MNRRDQRVFAPTFTNNKDLHGGAFKSEVAHERKSLSCFRTLPPSTLEANPSAVDDSIVQPIEVGGSNEFLRGCGKIGEQRIATAWVEFAEDVVNQDDRGGAALVLKHPGLRQLQRQRDRALLPL